MVFQWLWKRFSTVSSTEDELPDVNIDVNIDVNERGINEDGENVPIDGLGNPAAPEMDKLD
ncbi:MAG TPA: hypothetical protein VJH91_00400 [Candidatus Paceibacterota bacterium]